MKEISKEGKELPKVKMTKISGLTVAEKELFESFLRSNYKDVVQKVLLAVFNTQASAWIDGANVEDLGPDGIYANHLKHRGAKVIATNFCSFVESENAKLKKIDADEGSH